MQFSCPSCGRVLEAPDGAFAKEGKCRFCGTDIVSPAANGASATLKPGAQPTSFGQPNQPPPPQGYQPYAAYQPGPSRGSGMAVASVIFGVLGFVTCGATTLFGLICGIIALVQTGPDSDRRNGRTMAIIGTVLSAVLVLMIPIQAAILFPVLAKARERAQMTSCMTKVRGLDQAIMLYQADHNGRLPVAATWHSAVSGRIPGGLNDPFTCPVTRDGTVPYKMNSAASSLLLARVTAPSRLVVLFEGRPGLSSGGRQSGGPMEVGAVHSGGTLATYGFADGSVKALSPGRVPIMAWEP